MMLVFNPTKILCCLNLPKQFCSVINFSIHNVNSMLISTIVIR